MPLDTTPLQYQQPASTIDPALYANAIRADSDAAALQYQTGGAAPLAPPSGPAPAPGGGEPFSPNIINDLSGTYTPGGRPSDVNSSNDAMLPPGSPVMSDDTGWGLQPMAPQQAGVGGMGSARGGDIGYQGIRRNEPMAAQAPQGTGQAGVGPQFRGYGPRPQQGR